MAEVEIKGHRYRYEYENGQTIYRGPIGDGPELSEVEFMAAMNGKGGKRKDYSHFPIVKERVPVQYGNLSKEPRKVYNLGYEGSLLHEREMWHYYRIHEDEPSGGRFFLRHSWKEEGDEPGEHSYSYQYIKYRELPEALRNKIEGKPYNKSWGIR